MLSVEELSEDKLGKGSDVRLVCFFRIFRIASELPNENYSEKMLVGHEDMSR